MQSTISLFFVFQSLSISPKLVFQRYIISIEVAMKDNLTALFKAMRLPFLLLTLSVVLLAIAAAINTGVKVSSTDIILVFFGALAAHISVNLLNEYQDYHSGLDALTEKTPFSGGSGALIDNPSAAQFIAKMTVFFLVLAIVIGAYFAATIGLTIIIIGLSGLAIILFYTQWINKQPILCLISSGLAFGPLMILGTYVVLTAEVSWHVFSISLVPFFLTNNLLLINQFPDIAADKSVGRNHFSICYGINTSLYVYLSFSLLALISTIMVLFNHDSSAFAYLTLAPILLALLVISVFMKNRTIMKNIITAMLVSVISAVLTPLFLATAIYLT